MASESMVFVWSQTFTSFKMSSKLGVPPEEVRMTVNQVTKLQVLCTGGTKPLKPILS
jgi:hypothetical protein